MSGITGLVLLHGRGGSAASMRALLAPLNAESFSVAGPEAPGSSWWPTSFLAPSDQVEPYVRRGMEAIEHAVDQLDLPLGQIALLGFSQGGCLALEYAARQGADLGAVIAFSSGLVGTADTGVANDMLYGARDKTFAYDGDLNGTKLVLTCHEADPHIPIKRARDSADVLRDLGADVTAIWHPGAGHQPLAQGLAAARTALGTG